MSRIDDAMYQVAISDTIPHDQKKLILKQLQKALPTDRWTYRYVIVGLILLVLVPFVWMIVAYANDDKLDANSIPQSIVSLASTALGALAAYITPRRTESDQDRRGDADGSAVGTTAPGRSAQRTTEAGTSGTP